MSRCGYERGCPGFAEADHAFTRAVPLVWSAGVAAAGWLGRVVGVDGAVKSGLVNGLGLLVSWACSTGLSTGLLEPSAFVPSRACMVFLCVLKLHEACHVVPCAVSLC